MRFANCHNCTCQISIKPLIYVFYSWIHTLSRLLLSDDFSIFSTLKPLLNLTRVIATNVVVQPTITYIENKDSEID